MGEVRKISWGKGLYYLFSSWGSRGCQQMINEYNPDILLNEVDWEKVFKRDELLINGHKSWDEIFLYWVCFQCDRASIGVALEFYFKEKTNMHPVAYAIKNNLLGVLTFLVKEVKYQLEDFVDWVKVFERDEMLINENKPLNEIFLYWIFSHYDRDSFRVALELYFKEKTNMHPVVYAIKNNLLGVLFFLVQGMRYQLDDLDAEGGFLLYALLDHGYEDHYRVMMHEPNWRNGKIFEFIQDLYKNSASICWQDILLLKLNSPLFSLGSEQSLLDFLEWIKDLIGFEINNGSAILLVAISSKLDHVVKWLVRDPGAIDNQGNTLLHYMAQVGDSQQIAGCLLEGGVSIEAQNQAGKTPRMVAKECGNEKDFVEALRHVESVSAYLYNCFFWGVDLLWVMYHRVEKACSGRLYVAEGDNPVFSEFLNEGNGAPATYLSNQAGQLPFSDERYEVAKRAIHQS